jgi:hypothetical protein
MIESNIELNCDSKNSMSQSDVALNSVSLLQGFQIKKNKLDLTKQFKPGVSFRADQLNQPQHEDGKQNIVDIRSTLRSPKNETSVV